MQKNEFHENSDSQENPQDKALFDPHMLDHDTASSPTPEDTFSDIPLPNEIFDRYSTAKPTESFNADIDQYGVDSSRLEGFDDIPVPDELKYQFESEAPPATTKPKAEATVTKDTHEPISNEKKIDPEPESSFTTPQFAHKTVFSTSPRVIIPPLILAICMTIGSYFVPALSAEDAAQLPQFMAQNYETILQYLIFGAAAFVLFLGIRSSANGKLLLYSDYVERRKGMFNKQKVHFCDIRSVHVHRAPFSALLNLGHVEILCRNHVLELKSVHDPFTLKDMIIKGISK